jgi:hypothetical protein
MFNCIINPKNAIKQAKENKSFAKPVLMLGIGLLLFLASIIIALLKTQAPISAQFTRWMVFLAFCMVLVTFAISLLINIILSIFGKISSMRHSLTVIGLGAYIMGIGLFISTIIFSLIPRATGEMMTYVIMTMAIISFLVLFITFGLAFVVMMKAAMALFEVELMTVFVTMSIVFSLLLWLLYFLFMRLFLRSMSLGSGKKMAKKVSWILALLMSIFFGYLGIDRFIMGQVGIGILKLITFGGCGIWQLIDIILIATKHQFKDVEWVQ